MGEQFVAVQHRAPAPGRPVFIRRLMIRCPVTGLPTDTGLEQSSFPEGPGGEDQLLVDCLECGQDHPWSMADAFAEPIVAPPLDALAAAPTAPSRAPVRSST
jgi:hypothetical protein